MVTGVVYVDLTDETLDRYALHGLDNVPDGARTILFVDNRTFALPDSYRLIRKHLTRLELEVHGSQEAVRVWIHNLKNPTLWAVG